MTDPGLGHPPCEAPSHAGPDKGTWDDRYRAREQIWSGRPNGALVAEISGTPPGRALDVGCGEGADAIWLALRGWKVTALDVSEVALERARKAASDAGVEVEWHHAGLLDAPLQPESFDLVNVQYPALLRTPTRSAEQALLTAVAPGGTLLVAYHANVDVEWAKAQGFDPADYVGLADVLGMLDDDWILEVHETRPRDIPAGGEPRHTHDEVLRARRQPRG